MSARTWSAALCVATALGVPLVLSASSSADSSPIQGLAATASTPTQNGVSPAGPLFVGPSGSTVTVTVTGSGAMAGKFFGAQARLCKGGAIITNQAGFNPTQFGNCIRNDEGFSTNGGDDFVEASAAPQNNTVTFSFKVATQSQAFDSSLKGATTILCDATNPCTLWLKESVDAGVVASGTLYVHFDVKFAPDSTPGATTTSSSTVPGATSTTRPATTTTAPGATSTSSSTTSTTVAETTTTSTTGATTTTTTISAPAFTVAPSSVASGQSVEVTSPNWKADTSVAAVLNSDPVNLGTATTDASGTLKASFVIPASVAAGSHTLTLTGTDPSGTARVLSAAVVVTDAATSSTTTTNGPSTGVLSRTGADIAHTLWSAWGLILAGLLLVATVLRRERIARR